METFKIQKAVLEMEFPSLEMALDHRSLIGERIHHCLLMAFDSPFIQSRYSDQEILIDTIELDLDTLYLEDIDSEIVFRLENLLGQKINEMVNYPFGAPFGSKVENYPDQSSLPRATEVESIIQYLKTGTLPWWNGFGEFALAKKFEELISSQSSTLRNFLIQDATGTVWNRMAMEFSSTVLGLVNNLIGNPLPSNSFDPIGKSYKNPDIFFPGHTPPNELDATLKGSFNGVYPFNFSMATLLEKAPGEKLMLVQGLKIQIEDQIKKELVLYLSPNSLKPLGAEFLRSVFKAISLKRALKMKILLTEHYGVRNSSIRNPFLDFLKEFQNKFGEENDLMSKDKISELNKAINSEWKLLSPEKKKENSAQLKLVQEIGFTERKAKIDLHAWALFTQKNPIEENFEETLTFNIENAGLSLLSPYLPEFFTKLGLFTQEGIFSNLKNTYIGVKILHFISGSLLPLSRSELSFIKILCGLSPQMSIPARIALKPHYKEEALELLKSIIDNWPSLQNTGVKGFQEAFLLRKGVIKKVENHYVLYVERKGFDVLLDSLPWSISRIQYSWFHQYFMEVIW